MLFVIRENAMGLASSHFFKQGNVEAKRQA